MVIYNSEIYHYGIPRRSGRYKWGSGKNPYHHGADGGSSKTPSAYSKAKIAKQEARASKISAAKEMRKSYDKYNNYGQLHPISSAKRAHGLDPTTKYGAKVQKKLESKEQDFLNKREKAIAAGKEYKNAKQKVRLERVNAAKKTYNDLYNKAVEYDKKAQQKDIDRLKRQNERARNRQITLTDDDKEAIKSSGNMRLIYKYKDQFSDSELNNVLKRYNSEKRISDINQEQIKNGRKIYTGQTPSSLQPYVTGYKVYKKMTSKKK